MSRRRGWLPFLGLATIALVALLVFGSRSVTVRTFALRAANQQQVTVLFPHARVCEGPVTSNGAVDSVGVWGASVLGPATLSVEVRDAQALHTLARGLVRATTQPNEYTASLDRPVAGGRPLTICLNETLNSFSLLGAPAVHPNVVMSGKKPGLEFSLVLGSRRSLLGSLGTAFRRASLFHPSWVGSWTFWLLAVALLATIGLGALAMAGALSADDASDHRRVSARSPAPADGVRASSQSTADQ